MKSHLSGCVDGYLICRNSGFSTQEGLEILIHTQTAECRLGKAWALPRGGRLHRQALGEGSGETLREVGGEEPVRDQGEPGRGTLVVPPISSAPGPGSSPGAEARR